MIRKRIISSLALLVCAPGMAVADGHENLPHAFEAGWKGEDVCEVLFESDEMIVGRCIFPPGVGHEKHYHNPHFGYIIEGTTFRNTDVNGEINDLVVDSGATWSTDAIKIHEAVNVGDTTSTVLIIETKP